MTDDIRGRIVDIAGDDTGVCTVRCSLSWMQQFLRTATLGTRQNTVFFSVAPATQGAPLFALYLEGSQFNSTWDYRMHWGWNPDGALSGEGIMRDGYEQAYEVVPGTVNYERYLECYSNDRTKSYRPFFANFTKSNGFGLTTLAHGYGPADAVTMTDPTGGTTYVTAGPGGLQWGVGTIATTILGQTITSQSSGNASFQALSGFAQLLGQANTYVDGNTIHFRSASGSEYAELNAVGAIRLPVPGVGTGFGTLFADASGNLKYTGPNGTTTTLAGP